MPRLCLLLHQPGLAPSAPEVATDVTHAPAFLPLVYPPAYLHHCLAAHALLSRAFCHLSARHPSQHRSLTLVFYSLLSDAAPSCRRLENKIAVQNPCHGDFLSSYPTLAPYRIQPWAGPTGHLVATAAEDTLKEEDNDTAEGTAWGMDTGTLHLAGRAEEVQGWFLL